MPFFSDQEERHPMLSPALRARFAQLHSPFTRCCWNKTSSVSSCSQAISERQQAQEREKESERKNDSFSLEKKIKIVQGTPRPRPQTKQKTLLFSLLHTHARALARKDTPKNSSPLPAFSKTLQNSKGWSLFRCLSERACCRFFLVSASAERLQRVVRGGESGA